MTEIIEFAEQLADGAVDESERAGFFSTLLTHSVEDERYLHWATTYEGAILNFHGVQSASHALRVFGVGYSAEDSKLSESETRLAVTTIHDVLGNPFRPSDFDSHWQTADVFDLATAIYEDRAFDRLPILADALMDAGCDNPEIINHCRGGGPHVRGCWVVDLILGKC